MRLFYLVSLLLISTCSIAWDDHAMLTKPALKYLSANDKSISQYLNQSVKAETLQSFLEATKSTLPAKLNEIESWAKQNERGYKSLPPDLAYQPEKANCASDLEFCFRKSVRMNLDVPLPLVIYDPYHEYSRTHGFYTIKNANELLPAHIPLRFALSDFTKIPVNGMVKMADIISTASMQPDFGFDTYLYEDSETAFGKIYGFGMQPLGNPKEPSHSQMMFHMSSYYDDPKLLFLMPGLNQVYPEYRAYLYMQLSAFAAENNHPYWAAVFMGWGLHYIQDLTQPYHTQLSYGLDTSTVLYAFIELAKKNYQPFVEMQTVQANRHIMLESLTKHIADSYIENGKYKNIILAALENSQHAGLPSCDLRTQFLRHQMNQNIVDYHSLLRTSIPAHYVNSPSFRAYDFTNYTELLNEMNPDQRLRLTTGIAQALKHFGDYTKSCVKFYGLK